MTKNYDKESFQRPLRRRFFKILRPFFVDKRARNPDVLIAFRFVPFKVCFDIKNSFF
jgi:hypothetical protein